MAFFLVYPDQSAQAHQSTAKPKGANTSHQDQVATRPNSRYFITSKISPSPSKYISFSCHLKWQHRDECQPLSLQSRSSTVNQAMKKMMIRFTLFALVATVCLTAPALADQALATAKNCMACHAIDKKVLGPAYKDVAKKYAGQKDAAAKLATKVMKGGSGVWGAVSMPANPQVNEAEANKLVAWILALK